MSFDPISFGLAAGAKAAAAQNVILASSSTPVEIYGAAGAGPQTVASVTIKGGSIAPDSMIELDALLNYSLPNHAGRNAIFYIGGTLIGVSYPNGSVGALAIKFQAWVTPDRQSLSMLTQYFNNALSAAVGSGAPFSAQANVVTTLAIDLTVDQVFSIVTQPQNDDIAELTSFSIINKCFSRTPSVRFAPSTSVAAWGDLSLIHI